MIPMARVGVPRWVTGVLALGGAVLAPNQLCAQKKQLRDGGATVMAIVADTTKTPLEYADVIALTAKLRVTTGKSGIVVMKDVPSGVQFFQVRRLGYKPYTFTLDLAPGDTIRMGVVLEQDPVVLDEIGVEVEGRKYTGRMAQFGRHLASGTAPRSAFWTEEDLAKLPSTALLSDALVRSGMLRRQINGRVNMVCPRAQILGRNPIAIVMLDGIVLDPGGGGGDAIDFDAFQLEQIKAIEVYKSAASRPIDLPATGGDCVVAIWTK